MMRAPALPTPQGAMPAGFATFLANIGQLPGAIGAICCELGLPWKIVRGVGVFSESMVMAVDSAHSSVRWRAAILVRFASMAFALYALMYSAWAAA